MAVEGAEDYITFLSKRTRYAKAWTALLEGNAEKYSHELKIAGYYTADETLYTKGVVALTNEFHKKFGNLPLNETIKTPEPSKTIHQIFTDEELDVIKNSIIASGNIILDDYFASNPRYFDEDEHNYFKVEKVSFWDSFKKIFKK